MKKKKGFTLIELIAVLVIMAIIALIVTPLVLNIIRKARIAADKRSIDAYGRSIEYAIATYLLDTGNFPTEISQLTIEYSGDEVVCSTTQLNSDSSVYLTGCTVAGRSVDYAYGKDKTPSVSTYQAYSVGNEVTYNNVDYYVIKDSGAAEETVTLLKAEPLTVDEVNLYGGVGTANNHVNMYVCDSSDTGCYQTAYNNNGYGGMAYYSSSSSYDEWTSDYPSSEVKYVVDAWKTAKAPSASEARLISSEDVLQYCEGEYYCAWSNTTPAWLYSTYYSYWTMTPEDDYTVYRIDSEALATYYSDQWINLYFEDVVVRPVIVLPKSAITNS